MSELPTVGICTAGEASTVTIRINGTDHHYEPCQAKALATYLNRKASIAAKTNDGSKTISTSDLP